MKISLNFIESLLKTQIFKIPYSYLYRFKETEEHIIKGYISDLEKLLEKGATSLKIENNGKLAAFAMYRTIDFDTKIIGLKTAKIEVILSENDFNEIILKKLIRKLKKEHIEYATYRLNAQDFTTIHTLENYGFEMIDGYLILAKDIQHIEKRRNQDINIRVAGKEDRETLQNKIAPTFIYSRFFNDHFISKQGAINLHKEWIANSIEGKAAETVLVAEEKGTIVGFISLEIDRTIEKNFAKKMGHILLIGVEPDSRGKHIAFDLTNHAFHHWFLKKGVDLVRVETQLTNISATRTYENLGFKLIDSAVTFRWCINKA